MKIKNDFSWRVWVAVLALHAFAFMVLDAALTLNRLDTAPHGEVQAFIVQPETVPAPTPTPAPKPVPTPKALPAIVTALPTEPPYVRTELVEVIDAMGPTFRQAQGERNFEVSPKRYTPPGSIRLHYAVTKGNDSAKATLTWRVNALANAVNTEAAYELTYEATYFGLSVIKQTSAGLVGHDGLSPVRFGDKRRGKSEQATHFDKDKQRVTFSNNRPEAPLAKGSQDRSSVLIQLASLLAADPSKSKAGQMIDVPVASTDELEMWRFEVQGEELLALPAGEQATVRLIRRARRAFDQTLELWLAPSLGYVPVRMRQQDSSGVTDAQLSGADKL